MLTFYLKINTIIKFWNNKIDLNYYIQIFITIIDLCKDNE